MKYKCNKLILMQVLICMLCMVLFSAGCRLHEAPQTDTAYVSAPYPSQVKEGTTREVEKKYPRNFQSDHSIQIPPEKRIRIGIREFLPLTGNNELGKMVTEIFTTAFAKSNAFILIERQQLDKVFSEFELNQSGAVDEATAQEIGSITGLDAVITGGISQIGNDQRIDARVIDVKTGQIVLAETLTPILDNQNANVRPVDYQNISSLARQMVDQLVDHYYR